MALIFDVKVVAASGKHMCLIDKNGQIKCFVKAIPEKGKANKEVIELLANIAQVSKKSIEIVAGLTSNKKRIALETTMDIESLKMLIQGCVQQKLFSD